MSELITNLTSILNTKKEIKSVLGTNSDIFADYPTYIADAIASGGGTGYTSIESNGEYDVKSYAYAYVDVPVPPGYIIPAGTYNITENGTVDVTSYASANINVPVPAGYIIPAGDYMTNINTWETVIDGENPSEITVSLTSPDVSEYETVTIGLQGQLPENASYIYENGLVEVNPLEFGQYNSYIYVDVPTGGDTPSGTYQMSYSDFEYEGNSYVINADVTSYAYATFGLNDSTYEYYSNEYAPVITENGEYVYDTVGHGFYNQKVIVNVPQDGGSTYTWTGLSTSGNPGVGPSTNHSDHTTDLAMMLYVAEGNGWNKKWIQIIPDKQYAYELPTSITAREWSDYDPSTYILTTSSGCTYSCDPSNYDNLTNVMDTDSTQTGTDCSYEVSGLDVYSMSNNSASNYRFFGSTVHTLPKLADIICNKWNTDDPDNPYLEDTKSTMLCMVDYGGYGAAYIPATSYFGGMTDVRNLAGRSWKMIFNQYQRRICLKDIVGPVAGSEIYLNEIDEVWANWMNGWNGSTSSSYNTTTGNIELQYTANYMLSNGPEYAELHQLEYRLTSGGTGRRIDTDIKGTMDVADSNNLSGTVDMYVIPRTNEQIHSVNLFRIDNDELQEAGYTQYDLTLTLKIPHDMWLYGSANHDELTLDWTITPSSAPLTDDVTALQTSVGTSWYTGNRVSGQGSSGYWTTDVMKSNKATSNLENYKIYEINVTGTTSGTHNFVPDLNSPDSLDINNLSGTWEGPLVAREDQNGKQMFTLDTTDLPGTASLQVYIRIPEKVLDPDNSEYMTCHIDYQITY